MSATGSGAEPGEAGDGTDSAESSTAHDYFKAIEEAFVRLRGSPLLISPADWKVAQRWHREGIPLAVVQRALEEIFERRSERGAEDKVNSLRYCARAVEAAWKELREALGPQPTRGELPGGRTDEDVATRLRRLADALPEDLAGRERFAAAIVGLEGDEPAVEEGLRRIEEEVLAAAEPTLSAERLEELRQGADAAASRLAGRLPAAELEAVREQLLRRRLREALGLPILSLL